MSEEDGDREGAMRVLPFVKLLNALDHLPKAKLAAIRVHDDLDTARSIAKHLFGDGYAVDLVFKIRALLVEEEDRDASSTETYRRARRSES